jgi:glycosyltransferase involved in cell wall biosynthesis
MKVCFITPYPLRMVSGVSRVITDLSKGLKERGISHLVITARHRDDIEKDEAIKAIEIDVSRLKNFRDVYLAIKTASNIMKNRKNIDILHLHSPHLPSFVSAILGRLFGKPVITTIHGKFPRSKNFLKRLYFEITIKGTIALSDKITFVDEGGKGHYNIPLGIVIENGIDIRLFSPDHELRKRTRGDLEISEDDVVLLFLGRLVAHKGIYDLLYAFSIVNTQTNVNIKLIVIGSGEVDKVSKKIESLNLDNDAMLLGKVKKVSNYYRASDIFVLYTSPLEGLPIALLEASSCGLSIISTRVSGIPAVIEDGKNGFLVEYGDRESLIQKIKILVEDKDLRDKLGQNARKRIMENYNIDKTVDKYIQLYKEMVNND